MHLSNILQMVWLAVALMVWPDASAAAANRPASLPVFPGAQGFGTDTPAGRGGRILKVTSLDDSGAGSLREAVEKEGPRIVVFEVGGPIDLKKEIRIREPYLTIAGQTAPSPGVTLKGAGLVIQTHDVLVQHLRIRVGDDPQGPAPQNREGLKISGRGGGHHVVCDHLSISWATDEVVSTVYGPREVTISNTIISEGLQNSIHPQGTHSKAFLIRERTRNLSLIGNLFAHNHDRNPRIASDSSVVMVNNVLFNPGRVHWIELGLGRGAKPHLLTAIGNVFIPGPNTPAKAWPIRVRSECLAGTKVHHADNLAPGPVLKFGAFDPSVPDPPVWHVSIRPWPTGETEARVARTAGARPADRDPVDLRIVADLRQREGAVVDSVEKAGGWPIGPVAHRSFDIPPDPDRDDDGDGYTNIEELLHQMARELEQVGGAGRRGDRHRLPRR